MKDLEKQILHEQLRTLLALGLVVLLFVFFYWMLQNGVEGVVSNRDKCKAYGTEHTVKSSYNDLHGCLVYDTDRGWISVDL